MNSKPFLSKESVNTVLGIILDPKAQVFIKCLDNALKTATQKTVLDVISENNNASKLGYNARFEEFDRNPFPPLPNYADLRGSWQFGWNLADAILNK